MATFSEIGARYGVMTAFVYGNVGMLGGVGAVEVKGVKGVEMLAVLEDLRGWGGDEVFEAVVQAKVLEEVAGERSGVASAFDSLCAVHGVESPRRVVYSGFDAVPLVSGSARSFSASAAEIAARLVELTKQ
jgi:hypothetical protein